MKQLIESIANKDHTESNELFEQHMNQLMNEKLDEVKKMIAARIDEQITVNKDGEVHTATGEKVLPSVLRQRRGLSEAKKVVLKPGKTTQKDVDAAKIKATKKIAPKMPEERKKELRAQSAAKAEARARSAEKKVKEKESEERRTKSAAKFLKRRELLKAKIKGLKYRSEQRKEAKKAKRAEISKKAEELAKSVGLTVDQVASRIKAVPTTKPTMTDDDYAENIKKNPPIGVGEKDKTTKPTGMIGNLMRKIGLREQALARAKTIVEARYHSGTGSAALEPQKGEHVVFANEDKTRVLGKFNRAKDAKEFAEKVRGHYPGPHKG
jgi:hypothetical protein